MMTEIQEIENELALAAAKFRPFASTHEGYAIVLEELDEAWDAIKANDQAQARSEMIQVAAMAIRFIRDLAPSVALLKQHLKKEHAFEPE